MRKAPSEIAYRLIVASAAANLQGVGFRRRAPQAASDENRRPAQTKVNGQLDVKTQNISTEYVLNSPNLIQIFIQLRAICGRIWEKPVKSPVLRDSRRLCLFVSKGELMSEYDSHHVPMTDAVADPVSTFTDDGPDIIKVSARSRSTAVAGAIAGVMRQHSLAEVQAIGAGAVNQAVKALAIARGYLERDEIDIVSTPYFTEVDIDGQERTAVRFRVEPRPE